MKYFCISDIHGHYDQMMTALNKAGFNKDDDNHKLVVVGDMVDRGPHCVEVVEYIYELYKNDKAIVIMGNHDLFLLDFLNNNTGRTLFNFERNGHKTTIEQFLGREVGVDGDFIEEALEIEKRHPYLKEFLSSLKLYFELDEYVIVHGGVDATKENWRDDVTKTFVWTRMIDLPRLENRILVVGHTPAYYIRSLRENMDYNIIEKDSDSYQDYYDVYDEGDLIHIDGGVYSGGRINVYIIEK